jgi:hypothetical protein
MPKHNLRAIPPRVLRKIASFEQDDVVVACVKLLREDEVARYAHLGIRIEDGKVVTPSPVAPDPAAGRYSAANVRGMEKVRRDLPMIQKTFSFESPNWGDWSKGSHEVSHTRDVYQRDYYPPKEVELAIDVLETNAHGYSIKFAVNQVLNRRTKNFEQELLYNLNILQENVGAADVFPSAATLADYTATIRVDWQILPPGTVDDVVRAMLKGKRPVTPEQETVMRDRIGFMAKLKPKAYIAGNDEFLRYFGAKFNENLVAFENVTYGNAVYVMFESWPELSRRSRVELLNGPRDSFERIEHRTGWKEKLTALIEARKSASA